MRIFECVRWRWHDFDPRPKGYKPRHRGGWFRGYNGPAPEKHEGATMRSKPKAEVAAVGEDPLLTAQIAIHQEISAEAAAIEAARVQAAAEKLQLRAELDAICAPIQDEASGDGWDEARVIMRRWGYDLDQMTRDVHHRAALAEAAGRDAVTEDIYATGEFDVDELNQLLTAEALLVA